MGNVISLVFTSANTINAFAKQSKELHAKLTDLQDPAKLVLNTTGDCQDIVFQCVL